MGTQVYKSHELDNAGVSSTNTDRISSLPRVMLELGTYL